MKGSIKEHPAEDSKATMKVEKEKAATKVEKEKDEKEKVVE